MPAFEPPAPMQICVTSRDDASRAVAREIGALVRRHAAEGRPTVLGLASGRTPLGLYRELVRMHREEGLSFADVTTFNLDEYVGLGPDDEQSYRRFMREVLVDHVDLDPARVHLPRGDLPEAALAEEAARYEAAIAAAGGLDLQVLGLGRNGHIAFNEPGSEGDSRTRVVALAESTRAANAAAFGPGREVPTRAISMGIGTILDARRLRVLAFGRDKASVVRRLLEEPVGPAVPATWLRAHPDVVLWLDECAAAELPERPA